MPSPPRAPHFPAGTMALAWRPGRAPPAYEEAAEHIPKKSPKPLPNRVPRFPATRRWNKILFQPRPSVRQDPSGCICEEHCLTRQTSTGWNRFVFQEVGWNRILFQSYSTCSSFICGGRTVVPITRPALEQKIVLRVVRRLDGISLFHNNLIAVRELLRETQTV